MGHVLYIIPDTPKNGVISIFVQNLDFLNKLFFSDYKNILIIHRLKLYQQKKYSKCKTIFAENIDFWPKFQPFSIKIKIRVIMDNYSNFGKIAIFEHEYVFLYVNRWKTVL